MIKFEIHKPSEISVEYIDGEIKIGIKELNSIKSKSHVENKKDNIDLLNEFCNSIPNTPKVKRFQTYYSKRLKEKPWSGKMDLGKLWNKWNDDK